MYIFMNTYKHIYVDMYINTNVCRNRHRKIPKTFADDNIINGEANSTTTTTTSTTHYTNGVVADGNVDADGRSDVRGG